MTSWWARRREVRRARSAAALAAGERHRQLVHAADWTITDARRAAASDEPAVVSVAAVQHRAAADDGLQVEPEEAAAVLRARLRLRAGWFDVMDDAGEGAR